MTYVARCFVKSGTFTYTMPSTATRTPTLAGSRRVVLPIPLLMFAVTLCFHRGDQVHGEIARGTAGAATD